ncbi:hypothetical protein [Nitratifractor sp.]
MKNLFRTFLITTLFVVTSASVLQAKESAYLQAHYANASTVVSKLKHAGFKVLGTYHPAGKSYLKVVIITSSTLKKAASRPKRGFAAIQRVLIDSKAKRVLATNPSYWLKAFLQKQYSPSTAKSTTAALKKALGTLTPTKDALKSGDIAGYHFMIGMPYYSDMWVLKKGVHGVKSDKVVFRLKLANGATLYGVKMPRSVEGFIDKIGRDKALVLPYTVLVEGGTAYALNAKYYLAISYPLLSMGQFMKISSTPDAIEKALKSSLK